ncbi:hypothetical protein [Actinokineospora globicatena]|uniref:hypothetical protein n=1 Tax=Actinokineospora globicatena TaxID=103729 RepID=UPI0020A28844|nr:hypothetical protein [Actinokineospora globicatena]MCP2306127.1 hypothetical protein [Actinokineospora globicatena]GLW79998.1 hypothetical protein Aglo01_44790 [Actinokineospora globicatena]GLW86827.1 hypothetical protein Aglo02_44660 [Actinokineospora globicatena]
MLTQPLHVPEARAGLVERLERPGYPQGLLRVGYPAREFGPTPRRPFADVVRVADA